MKNKILNALTKQPDPYDNAITALPYTCMIQHISTYAQKLS